MQGLPSYLLKEIKIDWDMLIKPEDVEKALKKDPL